MLRRLQWVYFAVFFGVFLTYFDRYLYTIGAGPYRQLLFVGAALPVAASLVGVLPRSHATALRMRLIFRGTGPVLAVFAAQFAMSLLWTLHPTAGWDAGVQFIFYLPFFCMVWLFALFLPAVGVVGERWRTFLMVAMVVLVSTTMVDVALPGFFSKSSTRASGFAVNANDSALAILLLSASLATYGARRVFDGLLLVMTGVTVFFTLSRAGLLLYLTFVLCYLVAVLRPDRQLARRTLPTLLVLGVTAPLAWVSVRYLIATQEFFSSTYFARRMTMFSSTSELVPQGESRVVLAEYYWKLVLEAPLLGHGAAHNRLHVIGSPHNMYLLQWVNFGLLGIVLYLAMLVLSARHFLRHGFIPGVVAVILAALGGIFTHNFLEAFVFPVILGLLLSVATLEARSAAAAPPSVPEPEPEPPTTRRGPRPYRRAAGARA